MFFPERILSIAPTDKVLEIGPGGSPHPRADVLLEKKFQSEDEAEGQRGYAPPLKSDKEIVFYEGGEFPFKNKEFDYVICSHVLEHVDNVDTFITEIERVGLKGYLEFPTIYYDYIYNFPQHVTLIFMKNNVIYWMPKGESGLNKFKNINSFFYLSLQKGYSHIVQDLKEYFFQGFEWFDFIKSQRVESVDNLGCDITDIELTERSYPPKPSNKKYLEFLQKWISQKIR